MRRCPCLPLLTLPITRGSWRCFWSATDCLETADGARELVERVKKESAADPSWSLDYPQLERLALQRTRDWYHASAVGEGNKEDRELNTVPHVLGSLGAALASHAGRVHALTLTLSSPASFAAAAALVRRVGHQLHTLRLRTDVDVQATEEETSREGGSSAKRDPVAEVMMALVEAKRSGESAAPVVPLAVLELINVDGSMQAPQFTSDALTASLTEVFSLPSAVVALRELRLCFLNTQQCNESGVARLAEAMGRAEWAAQLHTLDLRGSALLLLHLIRGGHLRRLAALRVLDTSDCALGDVWGPALFNDLAHAIGGWYFLHTLKASQCGLTLYVMERLLAQLRTKEDAAEVALTTLVLSANELGDDAAHILATCLVQCHRIEHLDVRHNRLTKASAEYLISSLAHATNLKSLCLRSNRLGGECAVHLATYSRCWPALQKLDVARCRIAGGQAVRALASAVAHLESLEELYLSGNDLRVAAHVTAEGNESASPDMKLFVYDPNYMRGEGSGKVPTSFELDRKDREAGRVRYRGPSATEAPSDHTPTDPFAGLGEALSSCRALRILDLADCCLTDRNFTTLATALSPARLQDLRLGANPLFAGRAPEEVTQALVKLLWCCADTLQVLDLGFTGLGDWGLVTLCDGPVGTGVGHTGSDGTDGTPAGVLRGLRALRILQLSHAHVTGVGFEALTDAITTLPTLQSIALDGNTLQDGDAEPEEAVLARGTALLRRLADGSRGESPSTSPALTALRIVNFGGCTPRTVGKRLSATPAALQLAERGVQLVV